MTHAMNIICEQEADVTLNERIERFWNLDSIGITEREQSVYDKFIDEVRFKDGRYIVKLPFKEDHPVIEDNFVLSRHRLAKNVVKLRDKPEYLAEYDNVIKKQLELKMIEVADNIPTTVGEVTYLPHRAVIREDRETTKLRLVMD